MGVLGGESTTCIVGLIDDGGVYIGADSAGVGDDGSLLLRDDKKVFRRGPFLIGFTGSYRLGQLLHYSFEPPELPGLMDELRFMSTLFVDAVRQCLKDGGYAEIRDGRESTNGLFLVGFRGNLYRIDVDYQVGVPLYPFCAVGSGFQVAHGALYASAATGKLPRQRVVEALEAAEHFVTTVRGPFLVMHLENGS